MLPTTQEELRQRKISYQVVKLGQADQETEVHIQPVDGHRKDNSSHEHRRIANAVVLDGHNIERALRQSQNDVKEKRNFQGSLNRAN